MIAASPLFARLVFIELTAAGPVGRDRAQAATGRLLSPLRIGAPADGITPPPAVVVEAISGGIWTAIEQEVAHGRGAKLTTLAPGLTDFALVPFTVEHD
jgi:hypothetical protein